MSGRLRRSVVSFGLVLALVGTTAGNCPRPGNDPANPKCVGLKGQPKECPKEWGETSKP